jgi:hypothetical protein
MKKYTKSYKIEITPYHAPDASYTVELTTGDLEWSMDEYARNRDPFAWKIIEQNEN